MQQHFLLIVRQFGLLHWKTISHAMHQFTDRRNADTPDELWLVEHHSIFTQGKTGKAEHLLMPGDIPVFQADRGGQITYHGVGQQIMYILIDLKRRKLGVRQLVTCIEQAVVDTLSHYGIDSCTYPNAPGVYIAEKKICSIGLRIRHGCSLHGLALNIAMDLAPFQRINPCGCVGLKMTQLSVFCPGVTPADVRPILIEKFLHQLAISPASWRLEAGIELFSQ